MACKKLTVRVDFLKTFVNEQLAIEDTHEEYRKALCLLLEKVLMDSGQYDGFQSYDWRHGGYDNWKKDGRPDDKTPYSGPRYKRAYY